MYAYLNGNEFAENKRENVCQIWLFLSFRKRLLPVALPRNAMSIFRIDEQEQKDYTKVIIAKTMPGRAEAISDSPRDYTFNKQKLAVKSKSLLLVFAFCLLLLADDADGIIAMTKTMSMPINKSFDPTSRAKELLIWMRSVITIEHQDHKLSRRLSIPTFVSQSLRPRKVHIFAQQIGNFKQIFEPETNKN